MKKAFTPAPLGTPEMYLPGWVASEHLNFFATKPPVYKKSVILKTMPFIMEEYLIESLDNYHFTIIIEGRNKPISIFATTHGKMEEWRQLLATVNVIPTALFPDLLALPNDAGNIHVYISNDRSLARTGDFTGFCGKGELFFSLLEQQARELNKDIKIYAEKASLIPENLKSKIVEQKINWLDLLQNSPLPDPNSNLLHGQHNIENNIKQQNHVNFSPVYMLLVTVAFVGLIFVNDLLNISSYRQQTQAIEQLSRDMYTQMFSQDLNDVGQLRNRVLLNLQDASGISSQLGSGVWSRLRDLSDILASCSDCNLIEFKLSSGSRRAEVVFESRQESSNYANYFTEGGWRVLAWRSEEVPTEEGFYKVYTNRVVIEENRE